MITEKFEIQLAKGIYQVYPLSYSPHKIRELPILSTTSILNALKCVQGKCETYEKSVVLIDIDRDCRDTTYNWDGTVLETIHCSVCNVDITFSDIYEVDGQNSLCFDCNVEQHHLDCFEQGMVILSS